MALLHHRPGFLPGMQPAVKHRPQLILPRGHHGLDSLPACRAGAVPLMHHHIQPALGGHRQLGGKTLPLTVQIGLPRPAFRGGMVEVEPRLPNANTARMLRQVTQPGTPVGVRFFGHISGMQPHRGPDLGITFRELQAPAAAFHITTDGNDPVHSGRRGPRQHGFQVFRKSFGSQMRMGIGQHDQTTSGIPAAMQAVAWAGRKGRAPGRPRNLTCCGPAASCCWHPRLRGPLP